MASSFGILLLAGGIFGQRFTIGLTGRASTTQWYGRAWLIGNGLFLLGIGGAGLVRGVYPGISVSEQPEYWNRAQGIFFAAFKSYNGIGLAIGGLVASTYSFRARDWKWFWLALAFIAGGAIFAYDGIWSLMKGLSAV